MSDYELVDLFASHYSAVYTFLETFIAVVVSVLIAGYLVGPKLTRTMVIVIIGLFTMLTMVSSWMILGAVNDGTATALEIVRVQGNPDSSLGFMFRGNPPEMFVFLAPVLATILVTAYIGTIVFFFHARHHPREV